MSLLDTASLIVTPNAYKEGKLYSVIPSDGSGDLSVTRATTATRVNSAGLVELVPYNLIQYSNDLSSGWALIQTTKTLGQADPFGGNNAIKLKYNTSSSYHSTNKGLSGITGNNAHSVYAKAGELQFLQIASAQSVDEYANFNLGTGVIGTYGSLASQVQMQSVGNGWYRCSVVFTNGSNGIYCAIANSDSMGWLGANAYAGLNDTNGLFLYGAQVNQGSLKDYYPTETRLNIPRLDYSLGGCPSILVEPQRTNLVTYSEQFDNAAWTKGNSTIIANATTSPSGLLNADKLIDDSNNSLHRVSYLITPSINTTYCFSCFVKKAELNYVIITCGGTSLTGSGGSGADLIASVNLNNGEVVTNNYNISSVDYGDGWYRISIILTTDSDGGSLIPYISASENGITGTYVGTGNGIYLWGAQLEAGAYATSYIPTTSASVTRNADVISKTGISSLIGQTEGTLFVDLSSFESSTAISISSGDNSNRVTIVNDTSTRAIVTVGSVAQADIIVSGASLNQFNKIAIAYSENDFRLFRNGVLIGSDNSGITFPSNTLNRLVFALGDGTTYPFKGRVNSIQLYKEALTDDQLEALTGEGFDTYQLMAENLNYILQ